MTIMTDGLTTADKEDLETLVDRAGIENVLMALSEICGAKADHIRENWQDELLASQWATVEGAVGCCVPHACGL